jgi:cytochrome c oxidase subunit III
METVKTSTRIPTPKILLWVGIASIIMLFAAFTSAYIVRQAEGEWHIFDLPREFYISTAIILLSSVTMNLAQVQVKKSQTGPGALYLGLTLALGLGFMLTQFLGWRSLVQQGIYFTGNPSGAFLYVLTVMHVLHLLAGVIALIVTLVKTQARQYTSKNYLGVQLCSIYWHFLGGLWVYLFFFLLLIR